MANQAMEIVHTMRHSPKPVSKLKYLCVNAASLSHCTLAIKSSSKMRFGCVNMLSILSCSMAN